MDIRTGIGFDVHRFGIGTYVTLCGVNIAHNAGLVGHSDADVALHAITDALYGALAQGDIGRWFPPEDSHWKGMNSDFFLCHAIKIALKLGFTIQNIDCTIICQTPKITPYASAMVANLSRFTKVAINRINIKATTTEMLGFTGCKEGIAALATVMAIKL